MKKTILFFLIISVVVLSSCTGDSHSIEYSDLHSSFYNNEDETKLINLNLLEDDAITIDTKEIIIEYQNLSDSEITYNDDLQLEYLVDDLWVIVPINEKLLRKINTNDYILLPKDTFNHEINIYDLFGKWQEGKYRIVKSFKNNDNLLFKSVEFEVK
ncbi:MAG TPA: immunoglobulin-like domain-containing protein [Tissierellaceae bacterium]